MLFFRPTILPNCVPPASTVCPMPMLVRIMFSEATVCENCELTVHVVPEPPTICVPSRVLALTMI